MTTRGGAAQNSAWTKTGKHQQLVKLSAYRCCADRKESGKPVMPPWRIRPVTSTIKPCGRANSTSCSGRPSRGILGQGHEFSRRIRFIGTSFCTARTVIPGAKIWKTSTKTKMAKTNPPVAGKRKWTKDIVQEYTQTIADLGGSRPAIPERPEPARRRPLCARPDSRAAIAWQARQQNHPAYGNAELLPALSQHNSRCSRTCARSVTRTDR